MEPSLLLVFGPPPEGWAGRDVFDQYQELRNRGTPLPERNWDELEKQNVSMLFDHPDGKQSVLEEMSMSLFGAHIRIKNYLLGTGRHNGSWVVTVSVPESGVETLDRANLTWPPPKEVRDAVANALLYVFRRNWIGAFAQYPDKQ
ncbi:MAG TPA: hypothetical protein VMT12_04160 [Syntrophales bacterium]|nr:hypothetical protein [Syntrophales bacterium]